MAANGVTPAIQGLNICSGVITPRILGRGVNNPNNPLYVRHWLRGLTMYRTSAIKLRQSFSLNIFNSFKSIYISSFNVKVSILELYIILVFYCRVYNLSQAEEQIQDLQEQVGRLQSGKVFN